MLAFITVQAAEFDLAITPTNSFNIEQLDKIFPPVNYAQKYPLFLIGIGKTNSYDNCEYSPEIIDNLTFTEQK